MVVALVVWIDGRDGWFDGVSRRVVSGLTHARPSILFFLLIADVFRKLHLTTGSAGSALHRIRLLPGLHWLHDPIIPPWTIDPSGLAFSQRYQMQRAAAGTSC